MYLGIYFVSLFKWKTEQQAQPSLKQVIVSRNPWTIWGCLSPPPAAFPWLPCSFPHHWWGCFMYQGFGPPCRSQVLLIPSQNSQLVKSELKNQRPICPDLTKKKKGRGHLLCCYRVLLPIGPECSGKIGISSLSGQHSSEWRWDSLSDPFLAFSSLCSFSSVPSWKGQCL